VEDELAKYPGVVDTKVGYVGGKTSHPSYEQVCSGTTGHAEAVQITFDPTKTSYQGLVYRFLRSHTGYAGSGPSGQYRTAIFYLNDKQKSSASEAVEQYEKQNSRRSFILVQPADKFWPAEDYHQKYYKKHAVNSCRLF
jgi:methionine-S-sulfoxide reductase